MGRLGADARDNKLVAELLIPQHLVLVPASGEEVTVNTVYAGRQKYSVEKGRKCGKYKCRHCPAFFSADAPVCLPLPAFRTPKRPFGRFSSDRETSFEVPRSSHSMLMLTTERMSRLLVAWGCCWCVNLWRSAS